AHVLVGDGVFAIGIVSAVAPLADAVIHAAGIPEMMASSPDATYDTVPYTNYFATSLPTVIDGNKTIQSEALLKFMKSKGVTKLALLALAGIPSIVATVNAEAKLAPKYGMSICFLDTTVPFGTVDFTSEVLQMKEKGCNGAAGLWADS